MVAREFFLWLNADAPDVHTHSQLVIGEYRDADRVQSFGADAEKHLFMSIGNLEYRLVKRERAAATDRRRRAQHSPLDCDLRVRPHPEQGSGSMRKVAHQAFPQDWQ